MSTGTWFIILVCASFPTLIMVAVAVKLWEVYQASHWPETTGKVLVSKVTSTKLMPGEMGYNSGDTNVRNEPLVEYEYKVGHQKLRGKRITIGERVSAYEVESTLDRYPVGAVVTVYYDPKKPTQAVLERDLPLGIMLFGGFILMAFFIGVPLLGAFYYFNALGWLQKNLPNPARAPLVAICSLFTLAVTLFTLAFFRWVWSASRWPTTVGRVTVSNVENFRDRTSARPRHKRVRSCILYTYKVNGREYTSDRIALGVTISSNLPFFAQRESSLYPVGSEVTVHYDPAVPSEAVLHPFSLWHNGLWLVCGLMFALTWALATGRL